jgi:hypothetical protein
MIAFLIVHGTLLDLPALFGGATASRQPPVGLSGRFFLATVLAGVCTVLLAVGLSFVASLVLASPAAADNCHILISPADCQATSWAIGVIATLAGGLAVARAATTASSNKTRVQMSGRAKRERRSTTGNVDIQPIFAPFLDQHWTAARGRA